MEIFLAKQQRIDSIFKGKHLKSYIKYSKRKWIENLFQLSLEKEWTLS